MEKTKIIVVTHYEHIGSITNGSTLTKLIEEALSDYPSGEWQVRAATTAIEAPVNPESEFRADTTYATTIILDRIN